MGRFDRIGRMRLGGWLVRNIGRGGHKQQTTDQDQHQTQRDRKIARSHLCEGPKAVRAPFQIGAKPQKDQKQPGNFIFVEAHMRVRNP